jgi:serine/threonine protein kinase
MSLCVRDTSTGFARFVNEMRSLHTPCGTVGYIAPEIAAAEPSYDLSVDLWAVGTAFYSRYLFCDVAVALLIRAALRLPFYPPIFSHVPSKA